MPSMPTTSLQTSPVLVGAEPKPWLAALLVVSLYAAAVYVSRSKQS